MYINKYQCRIVSKGTKLSEVFEAKHLGINEYVNVLLEDGNSLVYRYTEYFNPSSLDWIKAIKITIKHSENTIDIEEVFSYLYPQVENFSSDEGC